MLRRSQAAQDAEDAVAATTRGSPEERAASAAADAAEKAHAEARDAYAALPDRDFVVTRRQGGKETETTRAGKTQQDVLETEQRLTEDYNKKMGARQQLEIVGVRPADEAPVTRLTTEPDHTVPGQHVAKNEAGEVVGKGVTPEAAQVDAQARQNAPYAPEAPAARAEVPGTRPVSDYKAGDDVTVELDGRYQNAVVEKLGRSTIHVRIGSRVWRLPPSKVMFPAEAAAKRAEIHARNLGSIEPAEAPARLEDQAVVPGPREDTGTTGPGTEARVLSGSADEQTPAPTLTTLTTQTTRTPAQLQLEKLRATRDALTNKVRTPAEERKLGQINNQIARAERAERTVERRTQEQQDLQDRRGGRPFEGPPQVGRERDLLDYKFNDGTSVLRSVYEETGHDPDSAVSLPIHKQAEILTQHMVNKFGFSSVEVAGYRGRAASPVEQHQAVQAMLDTTRALQDGMASLGLPHDAVSLGGTLRLVIEPKGSTNYFGAYVFDGTIKVQAGANSYGHEWTHAIDHMLAERFTGNPTQMNKLLTQYARGSGLDTSDSVQGAFAKLINTMFYEDTALATRRLALETQAQKVDKTGKPTKGALDAQRQLKLMEGAGSKLRILSSEFRRESATFHPPKAGYYASVFEMLARSHEAYLANKMQMAGRDPRGFVMPDEAYLNMVDRQLRMAYPKGDERLEIFAAWDEVHHAMRRDQVLDAGKPPGDFPDYGISDNYRWRSTAPNARRTTLGQTISREINAIRNFPKTLAEHGGPFDKTRPKAPRSLGRRFVDHAQMAWSSNRGFLKILIAQMPDEAKPILQKLADSVATDPGSGRVTHENFHEATEKRRRTWNFQYGNIKENAGYGQYSRMPLEERLMLRHNLVTGETTYPVDPRLSSAGRVPIPAKVLKVAGPTRQLLNELWSVSEKAGLKIGFAKNGFFPRHYDRYKAAADPAGFKKAAIEMYDGMFDTELGAPGDKPQALFEKWADLPSESKERAAAKAGSNVDLPVQMRELQKKLLRQGAIEENPAPTPTERAELQTLKGEIQQLAADLHPLLRDFISETNADSWHANLTGGASHEFDTGMPTGKYLQTRVLPPEADIIMRDFMEQDPDVALPAYFSAVARRASYAEQFGPTGEGEAITRAKEQLKRIEGVDGLATEKFFDVIADMTGRAPRGGVRGFLQIPHNMAQAASAMVLMERAMWSSLHEGITASAVTGDHRAGFATIGRSIGQLVEAIGIGNQAARDRTTLAEFLGVITSPAYDNTMLSRMGAAYDDSPRMGWLLQEFYRTTGLTAITNGSRAASVGTTNWFLHKLSQHLLDTDAHARDNAKRWFNELGLPESTHKKFAQWMVDLEGKLPTPEMLSAEPGGNAAAMGLTGVHAELSGMGDAYSLATRRLVDRIIQDPKPADRAVYANVPIIGMAFQLMSFNYSFHENVLLPAAKRILYQFTRGRDEALAAGSGRRMANLKAAFGTTGTALNTLAIATSMVGAALMVWVVRQLLFAPDQLEEHAKKGDLVEYALRSAVSRSGLQGKWDPVIQMQNHAKYVSDVAGLTNGPGRNWAGKNISDALMLAGNSASTNTAEFNQARAMYNLIGTPVAAYGLSLLGSMGPISRIGAGIALQGGTSPGMSNWVATQWAGHKGATLPGAGGVGGTGLGRLPKLGGNMPKLGGGGRGAVPAVQHGSGFQGLIGDYTIPAIAYTAGAIPLLSVPAKVAAGVAAAGGAAYGLYEANKSVAPFRGLPKPPPKKRQ